MFLSTISPVLIVCGHVPEPETRSGSTVSLKGTANRPMGGQDRPRLGPESCSCRAQSSSRHASAAARLRERIVERLPTDVAARDPANPPATKQSGLEPTDGLAPQEHPDGYAKH